MKRTKQWPVDYLLQENPNLSWDDLHDVREIADILAGMVNDLEEKVYDKTWYKTEDNQNMLIDHYFYLVTHPDYGTPMKAKYHDDLGGYFEIVSGKKESIYITPIFGKCKCKYFMPMPEMPDDYKEVK